MIGQYVLGGILGGEPSLEGYRMGGWSVGL